jgi:hypothetical protein
VLARSRRSTIALAIVLGTAGAARAQAPAPRSVEGRVVSMSGDEPRPVVGTWVTLHRVASDSAGPLDSVRTDASGAYRLRYTTFGVSDAIYFASTRYGGVAYFTSPLRGAIVRGQDAELAVFDTTSRTVPTTVRGRHLIVAAPDARGVRAVIEVYEVTNDTTVTRIDRESDARGTWSAPLPRGASGFTVREGEVPSDALVLAAGRAELRMPFAPGLKQIAFSYSLDADAFPLEIVTETPASVFEVLVEDPRGNVSGARLPAVDPVTVEGRSFKRFLGSDVPAGSRVVIDTPGPQAPWTRWILPALLLVIGAAMLAALARPRRARRAVTPSAAPRQPEPVTDLASRIAALDEAYERDPSPSDTARAAYERERSTLKARLAEALAARSAAR